MNRLPTPQEYREAIQNPHLCFSDPELKSGQVVTDRLGLPQVVSGGFASVYQVRAGGKTYAVRCFLKYQDDQARRYAAIAAFIRQQRLPFLVEFDFLPQGIRVGKNVYPILKMQWLDGKPLNDEVAAHLREAAYLDNLRGQFADIVYTLGTHQAAHGDLQHGNILVVNGALRLIDYDGMYLPHLRGLPSHEEGHRNYQSPQRTGRDFSPALDHFSALVIYTSLLALQYRPDLWRHVPGAGDECLLLRQADFVNPAASATLRMIESLPDAELKALVRRLRESARLPLDQIPPLGVGSHIAAAPPPNPLSWLAGYLKKPLAPPSAPAIDPAPAPNPPPRTDKRQWWEDYDAVEGALPALPKKRFPDADLSEAALEYLHQVENKPQLLQLLNRVQLEVFLRGRYGGYPLVVEKQDAQRTLSEIEGQSQAARRAYETLQRDTRRQIASLDNRIETARRRIAAALHEIGVIDADEKKELQKIEAVDAALAAFVEARLKITPIRPNTIERIGGKRIEALHKAGILSAADVNLTNRPKGIAALSAVHGSNGSGDWARLESWRHTLTADLARYYRQNTPPPDVLKIQAQYERLRQIQQHRVVTEDDAIQQANRQKDTLRADFDAATRTYESERRGLAHQKAEAERALATYADITFDRFLEGVQAKLPPEVLSLPQQLRKLFGG